MVTTESSHSGRSMRIEIGGRALTVRSDAPEERVNAVVALVNDRLNDLQRKTGAVSSDQLVLMTALTMAEELYNLNERHEALKEQVQDRGQRLLEMLDKLNDEPAPATDEG